MADLRLVSENPAPAPSVAVETFTFVKNDAATLIYRDGRPVDLVAAVDAFTKTVREAFDKQERLANELASTPRGIL
jgi:hypothetical protein